MTHSFKILLLSLLLIISCKNHSQNSNSKSTNRGSQNSNVDTINRLLDRALKEDSFEFSNNGPFLFIKSGYFLNSDEKNAIVLSCDSQRAHSLYTIRLYRLKSNHWAINDSISGLEGYPVFFNLEFKDYNFDSQQDIFITSSVTSGISMRYGHLIIIDPRTKKMVLHPEANKLMNLSPEIRSKTVLSEMVIFCKSSGSQMICKLHNKWINGQLKTISKDCNCAHE